MEKCYKEKEFVKRIENALGVPMLDYTCHIVDQKEMTKVMGKAGWSKNQTRGVVGFHLDDNVYVLKRAPWTTLHELIHRAGVNADRINRFLAEGLTELIASDLKKGKDEHRPTYPQERRGVEKMLKKLNMSASELGSLIAKSNNPPQDVAELFVAKGLSQKPVAILASELESQRKDAPSLNRQGSATIVEPGRIDFLTTLGVFLIGLGIARSHNRRN